MFEDELKSLADKGLLRTIKDRSSAQGAVIRVDGKELLNFSSNDYLGLSNHPRLIQAGISGLETYGAGAGASRSLSGGAEIHARLESLIASFKKTESALLFNSGYSLNTSVIPAIATEEDAIFSDELNHASLIDGIRLSKARRFVYRHADVGHMKSLLDSTTARRRIIVTDGVFSMDGDIAPIAEIASLADESTWLYIDDAHATGVLGAGRGTLAHFGVKPSEWIIQMGTFSKALGSFGAFAAGSKGLTDWLVNNARGFVYSTALPPCVVAASIEAIKLISEEPELIERLWKNRRMVVEGLKKIGLDIGVSVTPIIPVLLDDVRQAIELSRRLLESGIYVPAIRPPTVKRPRLRIAVSATHSDEQIERLINALEESTKAFPPTSASQAP